MPKVVFKIPDGTQKGIWFNPTSSDSLYKHNAIINDNIAGLDRPRLVATIARAIEMNQPDFYAPESTPVVEQTAITTSLNGLVVWTYRHGESHCYISGLPNGLFWRDQRYGLEGEPIVTRYLSYTTIKAVHMIQKSQLVGIIRQQDNSFLTEYEIVEVMYWKDM